MWCDFLVRDQGGFLTKVMQDFSDFITEMQLEDYPLQVGKFTWLNN